MVQALELFGDQRVDVLVGLALKTGAVEGLLLLLAADLGFPIRVT